MPLNATQILQGAIALHNQGRLDEADEIYRKFLRSAPNHPDALHLRALVAHAKEQYADAARFADAAIAVAPRVANFYNTAGEAWRRQGGTALARKRLQDAIRLDPNFAMAHHNLALILGGEGNFEAARAASQRALALKPGYIEALAYVLEMSCALGDRDDARRAVEALAAQREHSLARDAIARHHVYLAREYLQQQNPTEARFEAEKAVALSPAFWLGWATLGEVCNELLDDDKAELYCTLAANLAPENGTARLNVAHLLREHKRLDEAASHYAAWLSKYPDDAVARFGQAGVLLMRGDYAAGWKDYEFRWKLPKHGGVLYPHAPLWQGDATARLLLYAEQGLGDTLQMLRFLPAVLARGAAAVVLQVPDVLLRVARNAIGAAGIRVLSDITGEAAFANACPLMSLPHVLGVHGAAHVRMNGPYLSVNAQRESYFSQLLARHPGKKLGLVWRGGKAGAVNHRRALTEEALLPLLNLAGWTPVSLQFGVKDPVIARHRLIDLCDDITDFDDLAAAMKAVDVVVSLDTGPAHLAGALGLACYTLIPCLHDWRWGADGEHGDWYPQMTLVRQGRDGNWDAAVQALVRALDTHPEPQANAHVTLPVRTVVANTFPLVQARCRFGTVVFPVFDRYVGRSLLAYGEYSAREAEVLLSYLRPGDVAIDVGANLGTLTLAMAHAVGPQGRVLAFEPQAVIHQCLTETLACSDLPWVDARRQAVGAKAGRVMVVRMDPALAANFGGVGVADHGPGDPVERVTLDGQELSACRLIKIDVEGRELDVLKGAAGLIGRCQPVLVVECDRQDAFAPLAKFLKIMGYRLFRHEPPLYSPNNFRRCHHNLFPGVVSGNLLALPTGEPPPADAVAV